MSNRSTLEAAGIDLASVPDDQREVLLSLSEEETATFASIKDRLDAVSDVDAHINETYGGIFW